MITQETFNSELAMCRALSVENGGKCNWGQCEFCGVIPLLYKQYTGHLLEKNDEITELKNQVFN